MFHVEHILWAPPFLRGAGPPAIALAILRRAGLISNISFAYINPQDNFLLPGSCLFDER